MNTCDTIVGMNKHNQDGAINILLLPLIIAAALSIGALGFAGWAYTSRQDYKNNSDQKSALAATAATAAESALKDKAFAEISKNPLKTFSGPSEYGSVKLQYPKTWSAYIDARTGQDLEGYFNPDTVPAVTDQNSTFALRVSVLDQAYSDVVEGFDGQEGITVTPYALPKLPDVVGVKISGQIEDQKQGIVVILPVRDKTLKVFTESTSYENDFNNNILPNLTFSP